MSIDKTCDLLVKHYEKYPKLQIRDIFKYLYQSSFGCEHMISSMETVENYILEEYKNLSVQSVPFAEPLDGAYYRVNLSYLNMGLSSNTLGKIFYLSARKEENAKEELVKKLTVAEKLVNEKVLPFGKSDFENALKEWAKNNFEPVHHSDTFKEEYNPSYRVIASKYVPFLPLLAEIDKLLEKGRGNIAIEGRSASGKTTLGEILCDIYDCNIFHMDDFFLQPHQRTKERYARTGGNIDHERFLTEVLKPLKNGELVNYRKFDCSTMKLKEPVTVTTKKLNVIEGSYSMHPELENYYDFSVFLDISPQTQKERILKRNSLELAKRFFDEWIPLENIYFSKTKANERCNICIKAD